MTYQDFFKLKDTPFRLTPDLDYFFQSEGHGNALETLLYSIRSGEGFVQITGRPGVGKTILVRHLLNQLGDKVKTALILHPRLNPEDLLKVILEDLGISSQTIENSSKEGLLRSFKEHLLGTARQGCTTVIIVDEAQEIPDDTLEELRLLSNLETEKSKLLSIILVGQTELEDKLNRRSLKQLFQRITIRYRIEPFTRNETEAYIFHRLVIAGGTGNIRFSKKVLDAIHKKSGGIPRRINIICERALMAASIEGVTKIGNNHLKMAMESYLGTSENFNQYRYVHLTAFFIVILITGGILLAFLSKPSTSIDQNEKSPGLLQSESKLDFETTEKSADNILAEKTESSDIRDMETATLVNGASKTDKIVDSDQSQPVDPMQTDNQNKGSQDLQEIENKENPPVVMMPEKWRCIVIDRHIGQGKVWEGAGNLVNPGESFAADDIPLGDGVYILGKDGDGHPFIFNHHHFSPWHWHRDLAQKYWDKFSSDAGIPVVPLIIRSGENGSLQDRLAETSSEIIKFVNDWASAWRSADVDTYIQYYGQKLITYRSDQNTPQIISREHYYQQKGQLFQKRDFIALQISEPVSIIDPANPDTAVALFYQRYATSHYMDEGIKMLFLRQVKHENESLPAWIIEGRLWLPMPEAS